MSEYFISPIDPRDRRAQAEMDELLRQEGIRRDANLDYSCGLYTEDYEMAGIDCMIIPRFGVKGVPVSASAARQAIHDGDWDTLEKLVPPTTYAFFRSPEAAPVIARISGTADVVHH